MQRRELAETALEQAIPYGHIVHYYDGEQIHARGEYKPGLTIVLSGYLRAGNYGVDGRYYQTTILARGDIIGESTLFADLPRTHCVESVGVSTLLQLNDKQVDLLLKEIPSFYLNLVICLAVKLHTALEIMDDLVRHSTPVRLAKLLYQLHTKQQVCELDLNQQDCASLLGVTLLSAHQAVKKLVDLGLVEAGYGKLTIVQPEQLKSWLEQQLSLLPLP
jgi:CRP/FNR family cyclic AMP-dependent transcriptional regulator